MYAIADRGDRAKPNLSLDQYRVPKLPEQMFSRDPPQFEKVRDPTRFKELCLSIDNPVRNKSFDPVKWAS